MRQFTTTQGNFSHAINGAVARRANSGIGMGIIASPNFPYDSGSVWNRNQLGALDMSSLSPMLLIGIGISLFVIFKMSKGKGFGY